MRQRGHSLLDESDVTGWTECDDRRAIRTGVKWISLIVKTQHLQATCHILKAEPPKRQKARRSFLGRRNVKRVAIEVPVECIRSADVIQEIFCGRSRESASQPALHLGADINVNANVVTKLTKRR